MADDSTVKFIASRDLKSQASEALYAAIAIYKAAGWDKDQMCTVIDALFDLVSEAVPFPPASTMTVADTFSETMDIYTPAGFSVIFACNGAGAAEQIDAKAKLTEGATYEIDEIDIGGWTSSVSLVDVPGWFNTCLFENAPGYVPASEDDVPVG